MTPDPIRRPVAPLPAELADALERDVAAHAALQPVPMLDRPAPAVLELDPAVAAELVAEIRAARAELAAARGEL